MDSREHGHPLGGSEGRAPSVARRFVAASVPPHIEVIHHGKNSLPAATLFQKRFARPRNPEGNDRLVGFNFQALSSLTGPGYFVERLSADAGEIDIDHTMIPKEKPASWPDILPNSSRFGRFVYYGTIDVMRGISSHVSIGRARKRDRWLDAWFVLVREDPQLPS
jgi:hypothetical protein